MAPRGENPLALGTILDSNVSSAAISATHIVSSNFVVDGLFGFTRQHTYQQPPGKGTCWGEQVGILNACQPPLQRDYSMPRVDIARSGARTATASASTTTRRRSSTTSTRNGNGW